MSNVRELPRPNRTHDEAGTWIARIDRGLTATERQVLGEWLAADPDNERMFLQMARLWDRMDVLSHLADVSPAGPRTPARLPRLWATAATVTLVAALGVWLSLLNLSQEEMGEGAVSAHLSTYQTEIGQQASYELPDSTRLILNTDTLVRIEYADSYRLLTLERGEIHVAVAPDRDRPLSVVVGGKIVRAVGTEFNVEITSDQKVELVVTDGVVMVGVVDSNVPAADSGKPLALARLPLLVAAGESMLIDTNHDELDKVETKTLKDEDIAVKLSWREGNVIFRGEPLEEALAEIGRYTAVEFVFLDESSKKVRIAGLFKAGDVEGLLLALRQNFNITYERVGDDKVLLLGQ